MACSAFLVLACMFAAALVVRGIISLRLRARRPPERPRAVRATPFPQKDVVVDGLRLRYIDEGRGHPLLLVPGHTSRIEEYDRIVKALRGSYRVLVFDFPGSGYSDKPDRPYDLRFYDRMLVGFLDALGIGSCHLAGGSLGGNLVLRAAHAHPERFPRVIAWAPGSAWRRRPVVAAFMRRYGYLLFLLFSRIQSTFWYAPDWRGRHAAIRATFAYYDEVLCPGFVRMYWGIAADQMDHSLFAIAPAIARPTLLMWGDRDHGLRMGEGVRRLRDLMPNATLVVFRGARHSLAAERPAEVAAHILEFLTRD